MLDGTQYTAEVLAGNTKTLWRVLGVTHAVFFTLKNRLVERGFIRDRRKVSANEQLAIFLWIVRHGAANALAGDRFNRGGDTISL